MILVALDIKTDTKYENYKNDMNDNINLWNNTTHTMLIFIIYQIGLNLSNKTKTL